MVLPLPSGALTLTVRSGRSPSWRFKKACQLIIPCLLGLCPRLVGGNWLLQCSSCVDQAYFSDTNYKDNIKDADLAVLMAQVKEVRLREFDHKEDEFYNKFFNKRQLGVITQELQSVMPSAVALLPERRWTNSKGMSNVTKNVMMLRESQLSFAALGALQLLARKADVWDDSIGKLQKEMLEVIAEQNDNRRKREEMLEQILRVIAKVEILQHAHTKTEQGFVRLDMEVEKFKNRQEEKHKNLVNSLEVVQNRTDNQDKLIAQFMEDFRSAVDREARADLVEKRKSVEAEVEVQLIKRSIEQVRWEEEQKTIQLREDEKRKSEDHSSELHKKRVAHELAQKKAADLELLQEQEASNMRQHATKVKGEKELLLLKLESEEKRAEIDVKRAIEQAKVESEAKIREKRENEDVNTRLMQAEQLEKRQQMLDAIKATAEIVHSWIASIYSSPQNLSIMIGSIVACLAGVYLVREMAVLLREQLNKRLGRPSLVRSTNRRGMLQESTIWLLRLLRLREALGSEFKDVVLHPKLKEQVLRLADATRSAKRRKMPLQHVMFYGPPGTGKTMVAQRFAEYSGLEYAIMSGGDLVPLGEQGVTELHKLFKWVHRSSRGVLLFIDEADAFLCSRKKEGMSEALRNGLTTMLYHTGTPTSQFMMVLATNRPSDLDSAVHDRVDESVEFGLPEFSARKGMVDLYFKKYVATPLSLRLAKPGEKPSMNSKGRCGRRINKTSQHINGDTEEMLDEAGMCEIARRLHGFSGREISKLFTSLQTHILYAAQTAEVAGFLKKQSVFDVIDSKVKEHERTADFLVTGYEYQRQATPVQGTPVSTPSGKHDFRVPKMFGRDLGVPGIPFAPPPLPTLESCGISDVNCWSPVKMDPELEKIDMGNLDPERTAEIEPEVTAEMII
jgi:ATPase family AAA domain-containing protein 3A/B